MKRRATVLSLSSLRGRVALASARVGRGEPGFRLRRDRLEAHSLSLRRRSPLSRCCAGYPPPQRGEGDAPARHGSRGRRP
ncbi:protein of unassigned function [Methylobacterium oryzae CBMB20]|uniref:Protein of unassigned function n=1 Tax=Methylobacterium oryzae CBMB20 TaxID=693986 RepID=A0A089NRE5_9HYPH|nr:protein of unassigned function [Methylobacterium oryzae CBMB20]